MQARLLITAYASLLVSACTKSSWQQFPKKSQKAVGRKGKDASVTQRSAAYGAQLAQSTISDLVTALSS